MKQRIAFTQEQQVLLGNFTKRWILITVIAFLPLTIAGILIERPPALTFLYSGELLIIAYGIALPALLDCITCRNKKTSDFVLEKLTERVIILTILLLLICIIYVGGQTQPKVSFLVMEILAITAAIGSVMSSIGWIFAASFPQNELEIRNGKSGE